MGKIPTEYDFDQMIAEVVVRIGRSKVEAYESRAAKKVGWPIPASDRFRVGAGLAALVQAQDRAG
jgi:hypothetical protein